MSDDWAKGVVGTIAMPPQFARELVMDEAPWEGLTRRAKGVEKVIEFYWV